MANTIHTLFSSANPPAKWCLLLIRTLATIHASREGCDLCSAMQYCLPLSFNPRIPRGMRPACPRWWCKQHSFNPRIPCGMRLQFCTNSNIICWHKLLNININLSTGYYYLAYQVLSKVNYQQATLSIAASARQVSPRWAVTRPLFPVTGITFLCALYCPDVLRRIEHLHIG